MDKQELIKFFKDNLKIITSVEDCWETSEVCISLYLGEELITNDYFSVPN